MRGFRTASLLFVAIATVTLRFLRPSSQTIEVAKSVYLFVSKPYGDVGLDGNAAAILSNDGVLVFDANGTPASSAAVLAEIRRLHRPARDLRRELARRDGVRPRTANYPPPKQ